MPANDYESIGNNLKTALNLLASLDMQQAAVDEIVCLFASPNENIQQAASAAIVRYSESNEISEECRISILVIAFDNLCKTGGNWFDPAFEVLKNISLFDVQTTIIIILMSFDCKRAASELSSYFLYASEELREYIIKSFLMIPNSVSDFDSFVNEAFLSDVSPRVKLRAAYFLAQRKFFPAAVDFLSLVLVKYHDAYGNTFYNDLLESERFDELIEAENRISFAILLANHGVSVGEDELMYFRRHASSAAKEVEAIALRVKILCSYIKSSIIYGYSDSLASQSTWYTTPPASEKYIIASKMFDPPEFMSSVIFEIALELSDRADVKTISAIMLASRGSTIGLSWLESCLADWRCRFANMTCRDLFAANQPDGAFLLACRAAAIRELVKSNIQTGISELAILRNFITTDDILENAILPKVR